MRQAIKNFPIIGKLFIIIYEAVFNMYHYVKHVLLRDYIKKSRWNRIRRELKREFSGSDDPEMRELLQNIQAQGEVKVFNYPFVRKYRAENVRIYQDKINGYPYVLHTVCKGEQEKLYFPKEWSTEEVQIAYNNLLIEQDAESPHLYAKESYPIPENSLVFDCGVAEGNFSINAVKRAKHVYLFEGDPIWHRPLQLTFEQWKDKVTLVSKYISDVNEGKYISLDAFFDKIDVRSEKIYVKMDIEGYEERALNGFRGTLRRAKEITMAVCSYHNQDSEKNIKNFFEKEGNYQIDTSRGYMILNNFCEQISFPYIRRGLVFVKKLPDAHAGKAEM